ncbi:hypothetical protein NPX13_g5408 [Xylaria arbuscula]|uniref:Uncharacterized protein n=1 Tax=Xylaria arbuscula TaxID=114810 RepID=A0A9W8NEH8_9PEZI|nr:hypothetical protein NPX13_g5408 [Xylaria arbuscula]
MSGLRTMPASDWSELDSSDTDVTNPFAPEPSPIDENLIENARLGILPSPYVVRELGQAPDPSWRPVLTTEPLPRVVRWLIRFSMPDSVYIKTSPQSPGDQEYVRNKGDTTAPACSTPPKRKSPRWLRDLGPVVDDLGLSRQNGRITSHRLRSLGYKCNKPKRARPAPARPKPVSKNGKSQKRDLRGFGKSNYQQHKQKKC